MLLLKGTFTCLQQLYFYILKSWLKSNDSQLIVPAWMKKQLQDISDKVNDKNKNTKYSKTLTNSATKGIISQKDYFDKQISNPKNIDKYYIVENDDFVYNPRISLHAPYGPINRNNLDFTGIMSPLYYVFRPKNININFLEYYFKSFYWHKFMYQNGDTGARSDRFAISNKLFKTMPINLPNISEQRKIGKILKILDDLITLEQEKNRLLIKLKDYIQSALIDKEDNKNSLKFGDFEQDWQLYTLGDVGTYYNGLSGKTKKDFGHGKAKYVTYTNVNQNPIASRNGVDKVEIDSKQNEVSSGDILFTTSSETPEEAGLSSVWIYDDKDVYLNSFCFGFRFNSYTNPYFMTYNLRSNYFRRQMFVLAQGTSRYNISKVNAMKLKLLMPGIEEQNKIGKIFQSLDSVVAHHKKRLEKIALIKKILLQNMYI